MEANIIAATTIFGIVRISSNVGRHRVTTLPNVVEERSRTSVWPELLERSELDSDALIHAGCSRRSPSR
jgi:hypothetical protein